MSDYLEAFNYALSTDCGRPGETLQDASYRVESHARAVRDEWMDRFERGIKGMAVSAGVDPDKVIVC